MQDSMLTSSMVEEEIIAKASSGMQALPMLDVIMGRMANGLNAGLKSRAAVLAESSFIETRYTTWGAAIDELNEFSICGVANAEPWDGSIVCSMDPDFFFATMETQLSGTPVPGTAPNRAPSVMEQRIAKRILAIIMEEVTESFGKMTDVTFKLDAVEVPAQVSSLYGDSTACAVSKFKVRVGECEGTMEMILPIITIEPAQAVLSKMFLGEKLGGDGTWRDYIMERISGSDVSVYAQLGGLKTNLSDVIEWKEGDVIELGINDESEATIMCSGIAILYGALGHKKNDKIAVRVLRENDLSDDHEGGEA